MKRLRLRKRSVPNLRLGKRGNDARLRILKRSWMTPASIRNASPFLQEVSPRMRNLLKDEKFLAHIKRLIKKENIAGCKLINMNLDGSRYFKRTLQTLPSLRLGKRTPDLCLDRSENGYKLGGGDEPLVPWVSV